MKNGKTTISLIRDALQGKEEDYTNIPLKRAIVLLAIPMVIEMFMESLFAVVDVFFVAKLGQEAVATVGLTESVLTVVYSLGFGVSMAATALVSRRIGEKNPEAASRVAGQTLLFGVLLSLPISIAGILFSRNILYMMGASDDIVEHGVRFTQWMIGGNFVILLLFLLNGVFRGAGNASIAMRALWISNGLNLILDPLLIMGWGPIPAFGLNGAAYATNIGRGLGVAYQLYCLFKGNGIIRLHWNDFRPNPVLLKRIFSISSGGAGQFIISSASWIFLMRIIARFGDAAIAGYTIGIRVLIFTILPAWGMANAASTLVGQNLGAGKPDRAQQAVLLTALYNVLFLGSVSLLYFFLTPNIIGIFTQNPAILNHGVECLRFLSLGYIFFAFGMVVMQAFNGAGDTRTPTVLNFFAFWLLQIPLAYVISIKLNAGPSGVYIAVLISEGLLALAAVAVFRSGKWKLKQV